MPDTDILTSIACDYLTVTGPDSNLPASLHGQASSLFRFEAETGNKIRGWGLAGFKGFKCGSVEVGTRDKDCIVRLVSDVAGRSWSSIYQHASNVSRFDLQATVKVEGSVTRRIDSYRNMAQRHAKKNHDVPIVRWVADNRGGYTLYLGARTSIVFGRIYDKFAHTKLDHHRQCVRFEVQYHNKLACFIARSLYQANGDKGLMATFITQFFQGRDIKLSLPYRSDGRYGCERSRSDVDKNLKWLRASVRPTVQRLIDLGHGEAVLDSLGLIVKSLDATASPSELPEA